MSMAVSQSHSKPLPIIIVMGVCGCGKSTIGEKVAALNGLPFMDADDYHPRSNVEKMSKGIPLGDLDRWPWFANLADAMNEKAAESGSIVCGCSSLKRSYRDLLVEKLNKPVLFVYLDGDRDLLLDRMSARKGHYMPTSLLDSQLATLEVPQADENALKISIDQSVASIVQNIQSALS